MGKKINDYVELPSSGSVLWHDNGSGEENTLVDLLDEAWNLELKDSQKILVTYEELGYFDEEKGEEPFVISKNDFETFGSLKKTYFSWNNKEYSPEVEIERAKFNYEMLDKEGERRGAWGAYMATMSYNRVINEERKAFKEGGQEGLDKFREEKSKESRILVIG